MRWPAARGAALTAPRRYRASETPQAFSGRVAVQMYGAATEEELEHGTECLQLALTHTGTRARMVEAGPNLWKVTHNRDLFAAEHLIKRMQRRVALVVGGGRGIGRAVAVLLADQGLDVAVMARTASEVHAAAAACRGRGFVADASKPEDVRRVFAQVAEALGPIDVSVHTAGMALRSTITATDDGAFGEVLGGNLGTAFYCSREALRVMAPRGSGVIVNVGSSGGFGGRVEQGAYCAAKAGVHALTESLALEGKACGVSAYCVVPSRTNTALRDVMAPSEARAAAACRLACRC